MADPFLTVAYRCRSCGDVTAPAFSWQAFADGSTHVRAACPSCGVFLKYAGQTPEVLGVVGPPPERKEVPQTPGLFDAEEG